MQAIETKKWQDISLYIFGYHNLFLLAYIPPAYFFFPLIKWAKSQYRFIVTGLGGHRYYARVKVDWTGQHGT